MEKSCCFSGHRVLFDIPDLRKRLTEETEKLIGEGVTRFINGGALGFDLLAAEIVLSLRLNHNIRLEMALPCPEQDKTWHKRDRIRYNYILDNADKVTYVSDKYYRGCMLARNRYMVDNSEYCIAYLVNQYGGTYHTVNYALYCNKKVINIANLI